MAAIPFGTYDVTFADHYVTATTTYQFVIKETGEMITRNHRYEYVTEEELILNENLIPLVEAN